MTNRLEEGPEEKTPEPKTLDIIKIEGRWAQKITPSLIKFLDDNSAMQIDFNDYKMIRSFRSSPVSIIEKLFGEKIGDAERKNIHWGPEQDRYPHLKELVEVFGEYVKK